MPSKYILGVLLAGSPAALTAQLFIDFAGPRDVLYAAPTEDGRKAQATFKIDSADKSASAAFFRGQTPVLGGQLLTAFSGKARANDGLDEILRGGRWPGMEVAGMANWTAAGHSSRRGHSQQFINVRLAYRHDRLRMITAAGQMTEPDFDGGTITVSTGQLIRGSYGWAFAAGFERTSNYARLPEVEAAELIASLPSDGLPKAVVQRGVKARLGVLEKANEVPLSLTVFGHVPGALADAMVKAVPRFAATEEADRNKTYALITAAYLKSRLGSGGSRTSHTLGLSLTVRCLDEKPLFRRAGNQPAAEDDAFESIRRSRVTYPVSFFVEWREVFRGKPAPAKFGMATVATF